MNPHAACLALLALTLPFLCEPVQASTWQICQMELRIVEVLKQPYPQLQAQVVKVRSKSASVECPAQGSLLTFTPETPDYQATLPRRQWPGKGQSVRVDYRYLDGVCKGDGNSYACRIKHYPLMGR
ncbi:hypothetical protein SAMN03159443_04663 [Pseudomonas sp. NFACC15-1]|uniref:hypothetical protein n=1 Tax=unclassified Pseudomonas TaxID=196821 RepID=UPI000880CDDA|nr:MULTISPECIES: hypothetical protein [unclassified Pseudomonas]SDA91904.1 hypothetical protein SAMN03159443_04663 [Pseudomonas sp. NFACC15-1]SDB66491.1 hypothetical protein SAMN03159290_05895 [Pseudomonas sp. NFACC13-1]SDZ03150.1 hypothetical protein SAMN03159380_05239 [Pseudomonas sp. NFACC14]